MEQRHLQIPVEAEGLVLEGRLQRPSRAREDGPRVAVVAPPHPLFGGSLDNPVVEALRAGLAAAGLATLGFNWRGVGASRGSPSGGWQDAEADYGAALACLRGESDGPIVAAGYSFGAVAALRVALRAEVREPSRGASLDRLVLIAPPAEPLAELDLDRSSLPIHVIVGSDDQFAPLDALEAILANRPDTWLKTVAQADHFFGFADLGLLETLVRDALAA